MEYRDGISCVIVGYRSLECLKSCIDSLRLQEDVDFEIIVVDNDSRDGTAEFLGESRNIKGVVLDRNRGFGAAVNIAAAEAEFKYLFILNPDTVVPSGTLKKLREAAESHPGFGLIAPALEYPDGRLQLSARAFPGRRDFLLSRGSPLFKLGITGEKKAGYISPVDDKPLEVPAVSATAIMVGTSLFTKIGGFDERFFMYLEDIDLCRRIREKGAPVILLPGVKVRHSWRKSSSRRPYFASFHHHLSVLKYFDKYEKNRILLNLGLAAALIFGFIYNVLVIALGKREAP